MNNIDPSTTSGNGKLKWRVGIALGVAAGAATGGFALAAPGEDPTPLESPTPSELLVSAPRGSTSVNGIVVPVSSSQMALEAEVDSPVTPADAESVASPVSATSVDSPVSAASPVSAPSAASPVSAPSPMSAPSAVSAG